MSIICAIGFRSDGWTPSKEQTFDSPAQANEYRVTLQRLQRAFVAWSYSAWPHEVTRRRIDPNRGLYVPRRHAPGQSPESDGTIQWFQRHVRLLGCRGIRAHLTRRIRAIHRN